MRLPSVARVPYVTNKFYMSSEWLILIFFWSIICSSSQPFNLEVNI
jgi:hypothetical protein